MSTISIIVIAFVIGYFFIAIESVTKINKAICWASPCPRDGSLVRP